MRFDAVKRVEKFFERRFGNARALVCDFYFDQTVTVRPRDIDFARRSRIADGVANDVADGARLQRRRQD
jgi:hypothetical protein